MSQFKINSNTKPNFKP